MTQETRTALLLYMRQKFGNIKTNPHSPSYGRIVSDIYAHMLSAYPQEFNARTAANEARKLVNEVFVNGRTQNRQMQNTGDIDAGFQNTLGRIKSAVSQYRF